MEREAPVPAVVPAPIRPHLASRARMSGRDQLIGRARLSGRARLIGRVPDRDHHDRQRSRPQVGNGTGSGDPAELLAELLPSRRAPSRVARQSAGPKADGLGRSVRRGGPARIVARAPARSDRSNRQFSEALARPICDLSLECSPWESPGPSIGRDQCRKFQFGPHPALRLPPVRARVRADAAPIAPRRPRFVPIAQSHPCSPLPLLQLERISGCAGTALTTRRRIAR